MLMLIRREDVDVNVDEKIRMVFWSLQQPFSDRY